jgi:hypothetical protein
VYSPVVVFVFYVTWPLLEFNNRNILTFCS